MQNGRDLTFEALDELGLAFAEGWLAAHSALPQRFFVSAIGPVIELCHLVDAGIIPRAIAQNGIDLDGFREFEGQLRAAHPSWVCGTSGRFGIMRTGAKYGDDEDTGWAGFSITAKKAAEDAGFPPALAGQLVGAAKEMHSNIYEHSGRSETGLVAFGAHNQIFEVVVADQGIGVLGSLRSNPSHANLTCDAEALRLAIQPGVSRHSGASRGHGFDLMFTGLINLGSTLRFRSGTGSVTVDGLIDGNPVPIVSERAYMRGFLIAVASHSTGNASQ